MNAVETERRVLELLRPQLEAEGYSLIEFPSSDILPPFFAGYRPDAVALGKDKNVAIEVKVHRESSAEALQSISEKFKGRKGWEFRVVYGDELEEPEIVSATSKQVIEHSLGEIGQLLDASLYRAALVMALAVIEAIARNQNGQLPTSGARTTRQAIELLESEGRLSYEEAQQLRQLLPLRMKVVHGDFSAQITRADVDPVVKAARSALATQ
jgi:uncharacterized protein YutE (UPF0331/DUF86 family)